MSKSKHQYPVVIYPCAEGGFVAEVPSLPGCVAQGENIEECMIELETVIELWLETARKEKQLIPTPEAAIEHIKTWSIASIQ